MEPSINVTAVIDRDMQERMGHLRNQDEDPYADEDVASMNALEDVVVVVQLPRVDEIEHLQRCARQHR